MTPASSKAKRQEQDAREENDPLGHGTHFSEALPQTDEACHQFAHARLRPSSWAFDASLRGAAPRRKKLDSFSTDFRKEVTLAVGHQHASDASLSEAECSVGEGSAGVWRRGGPSKGGVFCGASHDLADEI